MRVEPQLSPEQPFIEAAATTPPRHTATGRNARRSCPSLRHRAGGPDRIRAGAAASTGAALHRSEHHLDLIGRINYSMPQLSPELPFIEAP